MSSSFFIMLKYKKRRDEKITLSPFVIGGRIKVRLFAYLKTGEVVGGKPIIFGI